MPIIHVHLKKGTTPAYRRALAGAIKSSVIKVLGLPDDDYNQVTYEHDPENMIFDPNFFGIPRSDRMVFVGMSFNTRPAEQKQRLFQEIARNVVAAVDLRIEDLMMNIQETPAENWWAYARTTNPETGFDSRMTGPAGA